MKKPHYKKIFIDMILYKFPEKKCIIQDFIFKKELSTLDIISLNEKLFKNTDLEDTKFNQQHKSYDKDTIFSILDFQKENRMGNTELAKHFNLSRNTVTKWKQKFSVRTNR